MSSNWEYWYNGYNSCQRNLICLLKLLFFMKCLSEVNTFTLWQLYYITGISCCWSVCWPMLPADAADANLVLKSCYYYSTLFIYRPPICSRSHEWTRGQKAVQANSSRSSILSQQAYRSQRLESRESSSWCQFKYETSRYVFVITALKLVRHWFLL